MTSRNDKHSDKLRWLKMLAVAILIALLMVLLPSPAIYSYAEVISLPLDETGGVPPYDWGYLGDNAYEDGSISVKIENGRYLDTGWTSVSIKLADPSQLRTLKAGPYGSTQEAQGAALARRVKSVLAIGGDFFIYHNDGYIVRQGNFYRSRPNGEKDVLVTDIEGNLDILIRPDKAALEAYEMKFRDRIVNAFTFGPALVKDGKRIEDMTLGKSELARAQRIALCQTGNLEYLVVYSEGPNDQDSTGLTIPEFAGLVASFPNVLTAYNLDGGSSATIVFKDRKINGPLSQRSRSIGDIIYFASAWVEDQEQTD